MRIRQASIGLIWLSALVTPVAAQTLEQQEAQCQNTSGQVAPAASVAACTALLQSGQLDSEAGWLAYHFRGYAYVRQGDDARAIADFSAAIRLYPLNRQIGSTIFHRGAAYFRQGDYAPAMADFNEMIRLHPQIAEPYVGRGRVHSQQGDLARALADLTEAIRLNPQIADVYANRAEVYDRLGDTARAAADRAEAARLRGR